MPNHPNSMLGQPLDEHTRDRRLAVLRANGGNVCAAARELNVDRSTLQKFWTKHRDTAPAKLVEVGYDLSSAKERSPAEAWHDHARVAERTISKAIGNRWKTITRPRGAFVIFHSTDEHIDDDAAPLRLLEADIGAAHAMNAVMCHGGDLLNNWPVAGKLAKMWAEQNCTLPDSLLRAQHFVSIFKPDVWTDGNHEEMNPYLASMLHSWLPKECVRDYWTVRFSIETGDRPIHAVLSHKFQKGSSWFHPHHGVLREALEGEEADLYMEGHIHTAGTMHRTLPERGISMTAVSSAGYKVVDKYAARISRGGSIAKIKGRAHWIVCDPMADEDAQVCVPFDCPRQAEAMLNGLQNLRAA
jgi:transposase-like protein